MLQLDLRARTVELGEKNMVLVTTEVFNTLSGFTRIDWLGENSLARGK